MKNWTTGLFISIVFWAVSSGCQSYGGRAEAPQPAANNDPVQRQIPDTFDITSIEFFAWQGAGANRAYRKIDKLEVNDGSRTIGPQKFDIVLHVKNKGRSSFQDGDLILMTTLEFIVAPGDPRNTDVAKVIKEYTWSRDILMDDIKMVLVPFLEVGTDAALTFRAFDLSRTNKVLTDSDSIERVWAIKANIHVLDRNMVEILRREAVITVSH